MESKIQEIKDHAVHTKQHAVHTKQHDFFTEIPYEHFEWLIEQAEKVERYEKALEKIANDRSVAFWELSAKVAQETLDN